MTGGTLIFFCGKMGAGKTSCSRKIAAEKNAVLLSEDEWLEALYPNQINSLQDYIHYSRLLKPQMKKMVQAILKTGADVVMDFPANTEQQRNWFREIFSEVNADHCLIFIDVPDALCLERIEQRRLEQPQRAATDTAEMFAQTSRYFSGPQPDEGFTVIRRSNAT